MIATLRESKARISELVRRAARGEEVVITVRGKPEARLCPMAPAGRAARSGWARTLREARATYSTGTHDSSGAILDEQRGDRG
jgi:prevent-host-death family protein